MSAAAPLADALSTLLSTALVAALRADVPLGQMVAQIDDGDRPHAHVPRIQMAEAVSQTWGAKGREGAAVRLTLLLHDRGDGARLGAMATGVARIASTLPRNVAGWEHLGLNLTGTRRSRDKAGNARLQMDFATKGWPENP